MHLLFELLHEFHGHWFGRVLIGLIVALIIIEIVR